MERFTTARAASLAAAVALACFGAAGPATAHSTSATAAAGSGKAAAVSHLSVKRAHVRGP